MTLSQLKVGQKATIQGMLNTPLATSRLAELGFIEGETIQIMNKAPFGDPIEVEIMNYCLCLRKKMADQIEVELNENN